MIAINIWDDYADNDDTWMQVESNNISDDKCKQILTFVMAYIALKIPLATVKFEVVQYDPKVIHPNWKETGLPESFWPAYWRLRIINLSHIQREWLVNKLNSEPMQLEGESFDFYSES